VYNRYKLGELKMSNEERVRELEELVSYHADLYFNQNTPELSDAEFDALVEELKSLNPNSPVLAEVGAVPSYGKKVKHDKIMGSLDKAHSANEVEAWWEKYKGKVSLTPKMDGAAVRLNYNAGVLVKAATRGNGEVGQDVTDNIRAMVSVPNNLGNDFTGEVRGEVFMRRSVFNELNDALRKQGKQAFANPRNAASGSVCCQDPEETGRRRLDLWVYETFPEDGTEFETESEKRTYMAANLGELDLVPMEVILMDDFETKAAEWEVNRPSLDYEIDGLVAALESIKEQESAGFSPNGKNPKGKIAYKFKPEQQTARVRIIDLQVGRTGRATPMARIEPTYVAGSTISNITLHNYARVKELDIAPGDDILIEKAGDIIPQVVRVVDRANREDGFVMPDTCPVCSSELKLDDGNTSLWCENSACPAKLERRILHWLDRLEVLGLGGSTVHALCEAGYVQSLPDMYFITQDQAAAATGGARAGEKIIEAILGKNEIPLWRFLAGLGIHGLGRSTSKDVAKNFKTLETVRSKTAAEFIQLDGIGDTVGNSIVDGLVALSDEIDRLVDILDIEEVQDASGPLVGKSFCLTGALPSGTKRAVMAGRIEAAGGESKSGVGKGLNYLVMADPNSTSSKAEKARKLGTECISEEQLEEMMGV